VLVSETTSIRKRAPYKGEKKFKIKIKMECIPMEWKKNDLRLGTILGVFGSQLFWDF